MVLEEACDIYKLLIYSLNIENYIYNNFTIVYRNEAVILSEMNIMTCITFLSF